MITHRETLHLHQMQIKQFIRYGNLEVAYTHFHKIIESMKYFLKNFVYESLRYNYSVRSEMKYALSYLQL